MAQSDIYDATERDYWMRKNYPDRPVDMPFTQVKVEGIIAELGVDVPTTNVDELEKFYLKTALVNDWSQTPSSERIPDLWLQLADAAGIDITNKPWKQAKHEYFLAT